MLRDYQEESSLSTRRELSKSKSVILCLPTGAGKTVIAKDFVEKASSKNIISVFLADREELIEQTVQTFISHGVDCQAVTAKTQSIYKTNVYVCMAETFYRRLSAGWFNNINIGLIILDEAHTGLYFKIIEFLTKRNPNIFIIGLTATPISSNKNYPLSKYYKSIVTGPSIPELIERGFLCKSIDIGHNEILEIKVRNREFAPESQIEQFSIHNIDRKMIELWKKHARDRQTIVYNINIEHNDKVIKLFEELDVYVCGVTAETPKDERQEIIRKFKNGDYQILCNVGVLTKGFDSRQTSCIVVNRRTSSISLWYQMVGRGGRPFDGKDNFITIDMGNNLLYHGSYNEEIDWKFLFENDQRDKNFKIKKKPKLCPVCSAYIYNFYIKTCPVCLKEINLKNLVNLEDSMPKHLIDKKIEDMGLKDLQLYAKYKGYKHGWAWINHLNNMKRKKLI